MVGCWWTKGARGRGAGAGGRTVSFSTMAGAPWTWEPSNVSIEVPLCAGVSVSTAPPAPTSATHIEVHQLRSVSIKGRVVKVGKLQLASAKSESCRGCGATLTCCAIWSIDAMVYCLSGYRWWSATAHCALRGVVTCGKLHRGSRMRCAAHPKRNARDHPQTCPVLSALLPSRAEWPARAPLHTPNHTEPHGRHRRSNHKNRKNESSWIAMQSTERRGWKSHDVQREIERMCVCVCACACASGNGPPFFTRRP